MKQKQINTGACTILLVEVPKGVFPRFERQMLSGELYLMHEGRMIFGQPLGKWEEICRVSGMTEDIADNLVEYEWEEDEWVRFYKDYEVGYNSCLSAMNSFRSLLRANGIDWDFSRTYIFKLVEQ